MNISDFFAEVLGAKLKNVRWSWGGIDYNTNRIFLRVWKDQIQVTDEGERVLVEDLPRGTHSYGADERKTHLARIANGAEGYGVVCTAVNPKTQDRRISDFDTATLLRLGALTRENGRTYAQLDGEIGVKSIRYRR